MSDANFTDQDHTGMSNGFTKETVLVTGFGPFGVHKTNASLETVRELEKIGLGDDYRLVVVKLDVEYDQIDAIIPDLWKQYTPKLVVHCGVSGIAKEITLEQRGHRKGYEAKDEKGKVPKQEICNCSDKDWIDSALEMDKICDAINKSDCGVPAIVSRDAGRYLCDYTYFTSLSINHTCTAFVHVPPLGNPYSAEQLAKALQIAILKMLEHYDNENEVES